MARMRPLFAALLVGAVLVPAACGPGSLASPTGTLGPPPTVALTPVPTPDPPPPDAPPTVSLGLADAPDDEAIPGDLGTYSWNGLVSDAPWIVGSAATMATPGAALEARVAGPPPVSSWVARWVRVTSATTVGDVEQFAEGVDLPILLTAPAGGSWSLQVEVRMGDLGGATWYWRVEVAP